MIATAPDSSIDPRDQDVDLVAAFLDLWDREGGPPDLFAFLETFPTASTRQRADVVLADQSRRWKSRRPMPVDDYLNALPDVAAIPELKVDLIYGEYRARAKVGLAPDPLKFVSRFADVREALLRQLRIGSFFQGQPPIVGPGEDQPMLEPKPDASGFPVPPEGYVYQERIGSGGMGEVFVALQLDLKKRVAIKLLRADAINPLEMGDRLRAEGMMVARLRHAYIVNVHRFGEAPDGRYFLVMDLVEGQSLDHRLKSGPLRVDEAVKVAIQVADALEHAHANQVIHRDIKPSNVLIDANGNALVTDFGLAKCLASTDPALTRPGHQVGTPLYMAPEQVDASRGSITPETDVYGLGGLLYALLTGRSPAPGSSPLDIYAWLASSQSPRPPGEVNPLVPQSLGSICLRCLAKVPASRYRTAAEVARALRDWEKTGAADTDSITSPTPRRRRRDATRLVAAIAGLAVATTLVAVAWPRLMNRSGKSLEETSPNSALAVGTTPPEITTWTLFRRRGTKPPVRLTVNHGDLMAGDLVRVESEFSRPVYAYLFWIFSDGQVEAIHPRHGQPFAPTRKLDYPSSTPNSATGLIDKPPGTDLLALVARDVPLTPGQLADVLDSFGRLGRMPAPDQMIVYRDGWPVDERPRGGGQEPLYSGPIPRALYDLEVDLAARLPEATTVSLLAVPRVAPPSPEPPEL